MKEYVNDSIKLWFENEIVYVKYTKFEVDKDVVEQAINKRKEMSNGKNYLMIADVTMVKSFSREARIRLVQKDAGEGVVACALLVNSVVQKTIFNFLFNIYSTPIHSKLFVNELDAKKWLEQMGAKQILRDVAE